MRGKRAGKGRKGGGRSERREERQREKWGARKGEGGERRGEGQKRKGTERWAKGEQPGIVGRQSCQFISGGSMCSVCPASAGVGANVETCSCLAAFARVCGELTLPCWRNRPTCRWTLALEEEGTCGTRTRRQMSNRGKKRGRK